MAIELYIFINNAWRLVLSIPATDYNRFALKPLKWLRFLGYSIYGREGDISTSTALNGPPVDYESVVQEGARYYFTSTGTPLLLDPECINDKLSDAASTNSYSAFRADLVERDGTCIVTNSPLKWCQACHYIPRSKGDDYIAQLTMYRSGEGPYITDINDTRNGILLTTMLHTAFGMGDVAFLKTPNFAMLDNDVPPSPGPIAGTPSGSPGRFILQHFDEHFYLIAGAAHNQDARQPADMENFPPAIIVDMLYGCAALLKWGNEECIDDIRLSTKPEYYGHIGSGGESASGDDEGNLSQDKGSKKELSTQAAERAARYEKRSGQQSHSRTPVAEAVNLVMYLWSQSAPGYQEDPLSTQEQDHRHDKVTAWLQSTPPI